MIEKAPTKTQPPTAGVRATPEKPGAPHDTWFEDLRRNYADATRTFYRQLQEEQAYEGDDWGDPDEDDWGRSP